MRTDVGAYCGVWEDIKVPRLFLNSGKHNTVSRWGWTGWYVHDEIKLGLMSVILTEKMAIDMITNRCLIA